MSNVGFPKVLILCDKFDNNTGMGVTLTNLFKNWPKDRIALASYGINPELCDQIRPCEVYYPLNGHFATANKAINSVVNRGSWLKRSAKYIYAKLGLTDSKKINISGEFESMISRFAPDIIFTALGDLRRIRFAQAVHGLFPSAKLALYIVDDWPDSRFKGRWFENIWRKAYDKALRKIISRSDIHLSICRKMSNVYLERYGVPFTPFHNPVDLDVWDSTAKKPIYDQEVFSIVYVGKINRDTKTQLLSLAECVEILNNRGRQVKFDIYTPSQTPNELTNFEHTEIKGQVSNSDIPCLLKSYSLLFLTLGFSEETRNYVKLSMPTKLTEYLASGSPILLYAPDGIALTEYLSENGAAYICTNEKALEETLSMAVDDQQIKEQIVLNASALSQKHDTTIIREQFRKALTE